MSVAAAKPIRLLLQTALFTVALASASSIAFGQSAKPVKVSFKVAGNCEHCQERIESVLDRKGVKSVRWSAKTQLATVMADTTLLSLDAMQKLVAATGHDTPPYRADDAAYAKLPGCCRYERKAASQQQETR